MTLDHMLLWKNMIVKICNSITSVTKIFSLEIIKLQILIFFELEFKLIIII